MKHLRSMLAIAIVMIAMAIPSISAAQYHEERLDKFLSNHPDVRAKLERNPNLIYDKGFREQHPELQTFLQNHPTVWGKLPSNGRYGAYGPDHRWHEADWWHQNDPGWMYKNHPEWAENHADWRADQSSHPEWFRHPEEAYHHEEAVHHEEHEEAVHHENDVHHAEAAQTYHNKEHHQ
jgi:hypothetical protein